MSADSETASYTSATALWDSDRQPCPILRRASMTRGALMAIGSARVSASRTSRRCTSYLAASARTDKPPMPRITPDQFEQLDLGGRYRSPLKLAGTRPSHVKPPGGATSSRHRGA
jgi:hypothetical protein